MAIKPKKEKISRRQRRKYRIQKKIRGTDSRPRLSVYKSSNCTYGQIISDQSGITLVSASTREKGVADRIKEFSEEGEASASVKSVAAARALGAVLAELAREKNIEEIVFDRNGYVYHGRIKAVADGARKGGIRF